ncbi:MAG: cysteine desulfurase family protein [Vicinamibacterales bacterium]
MPVYLDCAATTPVDPPVSDEVLRVLNEECGNAGSRTHEAGRRMRAIVERARAQVAALLAASRGDVVFTSGATESNNLAVLGLAEAGAATGRRHIISTQIEHPSVLEPLRVLARRGFEVELIGPDASGVVPASEIAGAVRTDTLLVSVMHVNNETGMVQPVEAVAEALAGRAALLHVDAAQTFGGVPLVPLHHPRIDLISISGHKMHAPQGVGALVTRRRDGARPPLTPLLFGGGQERGLRSGTVPVHLVAGLGVAATLTLEHYAARSARAERFRTQLLEGLAPLAPALLGDAAHAAPHIVSLAFPGCMAEDVIEAWRDLAAVSHGAACSSHAQTCSHVLQAMRRPAWQQDGAIRLSWSHATPLPDVAGLVRALQSTRPTAECRS